MKNDRLYLLHIKDCLEAIDKNVAVGIDYEMVWTTVKNDLPNLKKAVEDLLIQLSP